MLIDTTASWEVWPTFFFIKLGSSRLRWQAHCYQWHFSPTRGGLKLTRLCLYQFISVSNQQKGCWISTTIQLSRRERVLPISQGAGTVYSEQVYSFLAKVTLLSFKFPPVPGVKLTLLLTCERVLSGLQVSWDLGLWIWPLISFLAHVSTLVLHAAEDTAVEGLFLSVMIFPIKWLSRLRQKVTADLNSVRETSTFQQPHTNNYAFV